MTKEEQIKYIVDKLRPYLNRDGGDIQFIKLEDNTAYIDMIGACSGCGYAGIEMVGIKEFLIEEVEGLEAVEIREG
jgi:Fe-S cluster biogenesis protein NfuA